MAQETLFGTHSVVEALRAGRRRIDSVHVEKVGRKKLPPIVDRLARERQVRVFQEESSFFVGQKAGGGRGVAARVGPYPEGEIEDVLEAVAAGPEPGLVLVLDGVVDPQNFGAILRTALCAGAHAVVMPRDKAAPSSPAASRASAGAMEHVLVARVNNIVRSLEQLKEAGLWVYGTAVEGDTAMWDADLAGPVVLCIGSEEKGLRRLVRENCDVLVNIPQAGPLGSLNASVAAALVVYEAVRQRR
ncbi:MAG: 23S rRNA (guanosine(2251)-2'-O)-methyltransferase RlmB [Desulfatibacillaceae bacterium]